MTKVRPALSFERGLVAIANLVGFEAMGKEIGKAARTVMDYADHDHGTQITLADAFKLVALYRRSGGDGDPIGDCWRVKLDMVGTVAERDELLGRTVNVIKDSAEAQAALVLAARPGATAADRAIARRELEESIAAQTGTLALLDDSTRLDGGVERASPGGEP